MKKIGWITIGLCFVLLYSCPVKKFLILHFDRSGKPATATSHFTNRGATSSVKIEFLRRNDNTYKVSSAQAKLPTPLLPFLSYVSPFLASLMGILGFYSLSGGLRSVRTGPMSLFYATLYLRWLRLRL